MDQILLKIPSPCRNLVALVEKTDYSYYFSLYGPEEGIWLAEGPTTWSSRWQSAMRTCWIANRGDAPRLDDCDRDQVTEDILVEQGLFPAQMPPECCHHEEGMILDQEQLEVVWFEEGDAAALLYQGEIFAVIPAWANSTPSGCFGYAREFIDESYLGVFPLDEALDVIEPRVRAAQSFWQEWAQEGTWGEFLLSRMEHLEEKFGHEKRYFAIDEGYFPPRSIALYEIGTTLFFITTGVSLMPQPRVELDSEYPELYRRVEFCMAIENTIANRVSVEQIVRYIADVAAKPWRHLLWLGHGHTLDAKFSDKYDFDHILISDFDRELPGELPLESRSLPDYRGDPVNLLMINPITQEEYEFALKYSSERLINKLHRSNQKSYWSKKE
jgi:hypothetical protein